MSTSYRESYHFSAGVHPSERLVVFSSTTLQKDRSICKGSDIRRVLEGWLEMWNMEDYDVLVQEVQCDKSLIQHNKFSKSSSHVSPIFTRLMLQGIIKAAVRWISDHTKGNVLKPTDPTEEKNVEGVLTKVPVIDVLCRKHSEPSLQPSSTLLECDFCLFFETVEVTGDIIQRVASNIQGSAGSGGCDANHWQGALLCYSVQSAALLEAVALMARQIANTVVPWSEVRCLLASRLIALNKCPCSPNSNWRDS